jgi:hypothetical protein
MEGCKKINASKSALMEYAYVLGGDPGVVFGEGKKRKKNKSAFTEVLTQELSFRESESCKEEANNSVLKKETSEVNAADFMNDAGNQTTKSSLVSFMY